MTPKPTGSGRSCGTTPATAHVDPSRAILAIQSFDESPNGFSVLGFRRCYRRPYVLHGVGNLKCDCLRVEIPKQFQALSSGALATPERGRR